MPYRERVAWPAWCHLFVAIPVVIAIVGGVEFVRREGWDWLTLLPFVAIALLPAFWWRIRYIHLEAGADGVAFGFTGPRRRVARARILSATVEEYSPSRYMGWGYRIGWKSGDRAYSVPGPGRGVRFEFTDEEGTPWSIFVSSYDPETVVRSLGLGAPKP